VRIKSSCSKKPNIIGSNHRHIIFALPALKPIDYKFLPVENLCVVIPNKNDPEIIATIAVTIVVLAFDCLA